MTSFELEARISEFDIKVNDICKCPDLNIKLKELNELKNDIENVQKIAKIQKTLIDSFVDYSKRFYRKNKGLEASIFNENKMKDYLNKKVDFILKECDKNLDDIKKEGDTISDHIDDYSDFDQYKELRDNVNTITHFSTHTTNELSNAINSLISNFDIDFFKFNKYPDKSKSESGFKFFTDKLLNIYNQNLSNPQITNNIENLFIEIFKKDDNVFLIGYGISDEVVKKICNPINNITPQLTKEINEFFQLYSFNQNLLKFKNLTEKPQSQHKPNKIATCISLLLTKQKIRPNAPNIYNIPKNDFER